MRKRFRCFVFHRFAFSLKNKELKVSQTKYLQDLQTLRQKYKEQSIYMDQVLAQLTVS